jgi:hypothetical protein
MADIQASFIPKKDISRRQRKSFFQINIFLLIAVIIFLTAVAGSIAVYFWQTVASETRDKNLETLEQSQGDLGIAEIEEYLTLSNRLEAVDQIISEHVNVSEIFRLLEDYTLTEVVLSNFTFNTVEGRVNINAEGTAPAYEYVAVQADEYAKEVIIRDLILSDVDQNREGGVSFSLAFSVSAEDLILE